MRWGRKNRDFIELSATDGVDERAIRRAIRLGVMKTALNAVGYFVLASLLWMFLAPVLASVGGRREHLDEVVLPAIQAAHPDYSYAGGGCCNITGLLSLEASLELTLLSPAAEPVTATLEPRVDAFGRLDEESASLAQTPLSYLMEGEAISPGTERNVLEQLPPGMNASAVVLFDDPIDDLQASTLVDFAGFDTSLLYDVPASARSGHESWRVPHRIGWPIGALWLPPSPDEETFSDWTASLTSSDDGTLQRVGLPPASALKEIAADGVSGVAIGSARVSDLLSLLDHPLVQTVMPASVEFSLPGTDL